MIDQKKLSVVFLAFVMLACSGCAIDRTNSIGNQDINEESDNASNSDANNLIESASLSGTVYDFSSDGCSINKLLSEDGGQTARKAAEGNNSLETRVDILYTDNCMFQIALIDVETGSITLQNASIVDIKKSSNVLIFEDNQNASGVVANKVIITKYE